MHYIISYDIANDKRRVEIAKILEEFALRTQLSVFECELEQALFIKLLQLLKEHINLEEDSLLCYNLCKKCERETIVKGIAYEVYNTFWKVI